VANKIYIVAGERNMRLAPTEGGLYANVGQTTRGVADRLRDDDYKRKAAGGKWQVLLEQEVGDLTDKQIHPLLKNHSRVLWDPDSNNTEEFFFRGDPGDGSVALEIVLDILKHMHSPLLLKENRELRQENLKLRATVEAAEALIKDLSSQDFVKESLVKINDIEAQNRQLNESLIRVRKELDTSRSTITSDRQLISKRSDELRETAKKLESATDSAFWWQMGLITSVAVNICLFPPSALNEFNLLPNITSGSMLLPVISVVTIILFMLKVLAGFILMAEGFMLGAMLVFGIPAFTFMYVKDKIKSRRTSI